MILNVRSFLISMLTKATASTTSSRTGNYPGFDECREKILVFPETVDDELPPVDSEETWHGVLVCHRWAVY